MLCVACWMNMTHPGVFTERVCSFVRGVLLRPKQRQSPVWFFSCWLSHVLVLPPSLKTLSRWSTLHGCKRTTHYPAASLKHKVNLVYCLQIISRVSPRVHVTRNVRARTRRLLKRKYVYGDPNIWHELRVWRQNNSHNRDKMHIFPHHNKKHFKKSALPGECGAARVENNNLSRQWSWIGTRWAWTFRYYSYKNVLRVCASSICVKSIPMFYLCRALTDLFVVFVVQCSSMLFESLPLRVEDEKKTAKIYVHLIGKPNNGNCKRRSN